MMVVVVIMMIC